MISAGKTLEVYGLVKGYFINYFLKWKKCQVDAYKVQQPIVRKIW